MGAWGPSPGLLGGLGLALVRTHCLAQLKTNTWKWPTQRNLGCGQVVAEEATGKTRSPPGQAQLPFHQAGAACRCPELRNVRALALWNLLSDQGFQPLVVPPSVSCQQAVSCLRVCPWRIRPLAWSPGPAAVGDPLSACVLLKIRSSPLHSCHTRSPGARIGLVSHRKLWLP